MEKDYANKSYGGALTGGPCRQHAKNVLEDQIQRLESELNTLRTLYRLIDWDNLTDDEEAGLWSYFIKHRGI